MNGTEKLALLDTFAQEMNSEGGRALMGATSLENAGLAAQQIVAGLMDPRGPALKGLERRHGEPIMALLGLVMQTADAIRSASQTTQEHVEVVGGLGDARLSTAGTAAATAFVLLALPASLPAAVLAVSGGFAVGEAVRRSKRGARRKSMDVSVTRVRPEMLVGALESQVKAVQDYADRWILPPPPAEKQFHEQDATIDLLHELLRKDGAASDLPATQATRVVKFLGRNGIEVHQYEGGPEAPDPARWNIDRLGEGNSLTTILPALTHGGRALRKGLLIQE